MDYKDLQEQKKIVDELSEKEAKARAEFERLDEYREWNAIADKAKAAASKLATMEKQYSEEGSIEYEKTKDTEPLPYIKVKMYTVLKYNALKLILYYIRNEKYEMVNLNKKLAEKDIRKHLDDYDLDPELGVVATKVPKATLLRSKLYK